MANYKKMFLKLFDAVEEVINILIEAQKDCEEIYMLSAISDIKDVTCNKDKKNTLR